MYVSQYFDFENDILIKEGNAADIKNLCKNSKNYSYLKKATRRQKCHFD